MNESFELNPPDSSLSNKSPVLSIIVPTYNERNNVGELIRRIDSALSGISWEVIFVDDNSPDNTCRFIRALAKNDSRIRCLLRIGRRGLAGACIEGMLASSACYIAVMDADLQHDARLLPQMLAALREKGADLVVGSRYLPIRNPVTFSKRRLAVSVFSNYLARSLLRIGLTDVMSGFFMIRRKPLEALAPALSSQGFKILLDIVATARGKLNVVELPYSFGERIHGTSKTSPLIAAEFFGLILAKVTRDTISLRFASFALVGAIGLVVHLGVLYLALNWFSLPFTSAQTSAAGVAMMSNFALNNEFTYRDLRLVGLKFLRGFLIFCLIGSVGVIANVGVAFSLYGREPIWWLAGIAGALMGVIWNYAMSRLFVWQLR
jgi:dolichol-phosphate mannosyltransferase